MSLIVGVVLLAIFGNVAYAGQNWAVLVAGSNGWYNYRHQADICHAYQVLHKHGIPDSNIVVMMYDDIAKNSENPTPGIIINHPNGNDVYSGVPHDYTGNTVTPQNFINILLGNKEAMNGIGSGRVLGSGPDDNVFVFFSDHGATGLVAFPNGVLYAKDLNTTIAKMHQNQKYKEMVFYIEACESGSMFEGLLPSNINIYATTASNAEESSYACYYDAKRQTYLGDLYSVNWMEDSDVEDLTTETLFKQFTVTKQKTSTSHVMQYGDLTLGTKDTVSQFQGTAKVDKQPVDPLTERLNTILKRDAVPMVEARLSAMSRRLASSSLSADQRATVEAQFNAEVQQRNMVSSTINMIARQSFATNRADYFEMVTSQRMKHTQYDCFMEVTQRIQDKCFSLTNEYVLDRLWIVSNLCEVGLRSFTINNAVDAVCSAVGRQNF